MGFRFQKRISILPGLRINLSKTGASASIGPRGADLNIGRGGITTNAGLPGTGLSYRSRLGTHGSWLGVALLVGALAFWAGRHAGNTAAPPAAMAPTAAAGTASARPPAPHAPRAEKAALAPGPVYVHRGRSVLRDAPKSSGESVKREAKGARITLIELQDGGWAKVSDGPLTGYMRASVLGMAPP
jgi:hypothetical protein